MAGITAKTAATGLAMALIVAAAGMWLAGSPSSVSPRSDNPPAHELALLTSRSYESEPAGYRFVEGAVKNVSGHSFHNVRVVARWYDEQGSLVTSSAALIGHNPFVPGLTSEFRTVTESAPRMSIFRLEFDSPSTGALRVDDQRMK
jgi:hypothetical protein